ncbi:TDT family transporter [Pararhodospirillum photometricum]|uniref:C4-dicarboxylate transporter n=1 Tax=Pararhodospirillum photometricum DSM 122 TaxID=1150469 RepID=H6SKE3_PARPM|nr:TDT family transporter [Pararhodospirillum photometricum]CCG08458.1 C4-dicarboxylate transporter [Pararhodospirillum photometricum DSM 122]
MPSLTRSFTPNWFAVTMGTGVLALVWPQLPWPLPDAFAVGRVLWGVALVLFCVFSLLYAARWLLYRREARAVLHDPVGSLFLGTIPMGLATVVNGFLVFGVPLWGETAVAVARVLWGLDVLLALACGLGVPYLMFTRQQHRLEVMTAAWLLPIVAAEVAAASGGLLAPFLTPEAGTAVLVGCYVLWAFSVPLALSVLVILVLRLVLHKLPERTMAATGWLALGPIGTGALGLLVLGNAAPSVCQTTLPMLAEVAPGLGLVGGLVLWGYGAWWLLLAMLKTGHYLRQGLPFTMGWWGFTFPLGVYTLATLALARATDLAGFAWAGQGLGLMLAGIWAVVSGATLLDVARKVRAARPSVAVLAP